MIDSLWDVGETTISEGIDCDRTGWLCTDGFEVWFGVTAVGEMLTRRPLLAIPEPVSPRDSKALA